MQQLSLDYAGILSALERPLNAEAVGAALLAALGDRYDTEQPGGAALHELEQSGATYLFDFASSADLPQEDRTVAAWALTPAVVLKRDTAYQRGYPMVPDDAAPVDRGHVVPHLSGGEFGPNIFRQDRPLNRGWSEQGKRYRALRARSSRHARNPLLRAPHLRRRKRVPDRTGNWGPPRRSSSRRTIRQPAHDSLR